MSESTAPAPSSKSLVILSRLLLSPTRGDTAASIDTEITSLSRDEFDDLLILADLNHVVVRGFEAALNILQPGTGRDSNRVGGNRACGGAGADRERDPVPA